MVISVQQRIAECTQSDWRASNWRVSKVVHEYNQTNQIKPKTLEMAVLSGKNEKKNKEILNKIFVHKLFRMTSAPQNQTLEHTAG